MEVTTIVIAFLFAIVLSNVLNSIFPQLPLTLIQIAFGVLLGQFALNEPIELDPGIFMVLIIAPLLFREAEETDLMSLWKMKKTVFLMAFMLVFITVFAIGFSLPLIITVMPTAACFCLGAILGPTDVVAVAALAKRVKIDKKLMTTLMGEGLINDASGLIAFAFAIVALQTGEFHPMDAVGKLVVVSIGGILIGVVLGLLKRYVARTLETLSVTNTATHILLDLLLPFLCYEVAEMLGTSGVLAVVAAGTIQAFELRHMGLFEAELGASKNTLWNIVNFTLNSIVFLLLGLQLPGVIADIWENHEYSHMFLILVSLLATILLIAVRFACVGFFAKDAVGGATIAKKLKNMLLLSLSGVKGAVGLAMAFTLPYTLADGSSFKERPLILFITAAVIIIYLVLALIFVPLLSDKADLPSGNVDEIRVLKEVARQLCAQESEHGQLFTYYNNRIRKLERSDYDRQQSKLMKQVRMYAYKLELENVKSLFDEGKISMSLYSGYNELLLVAYHQLFVGMGMQLRIFLSQTVRFVKHMLTMLIHGKKDAANTAEHGEISRHEARHNMAGLRDLFMANNDIVVKALHNSQGKYPEYILDTQIDEREEMTQQVLEGVYRASGHARAQKTYKKEMLRGFYVERRVIHQFLDRGDITPEQANEMRVKVNKLETYTLGHDPNELVMKLMEIGSVRR